ncbi:MAG: DUF3877 family protein [Clostridia bacterium]|nr:DUF3877 family protein [Clostridia bacterium]
MNTEKLFRNIVDVVEEGQLKLGYREETIRLYYPLHSLNLFLDARLDAQGMMQALGEFAAQHAGTLGQIAVSRKGKRFCLAVPPEGAAYVHVKTDQNGFLAQFVAMIARHGTKIEDVVALFEAYSSCVKVQALHNGEFDYLLLFEDGKPDAFYYCITDEGCHLTYHRFTREDYEAFGF